MSSFTSPIRMEPGLEQHTVKCYSGQTYPERPLSFSWQGEEHKVREVEKEWREPGQKRFRVRTEDGKRFELCYDTQTDKWSVTELV